MAGWLGHATEHLAVHTGEGVGGLLNATFGNAAELIIAIAVLQRGLHDVVKASLTGSIIGNILLVAGLAMLVWKDPPPDTEFSGAGGAGSGDAADPLGGRAGGARGFSSCGRLLAPGGEPSEPEDRHRSALHLCRPSGLLAGDSPQLFTGLPSSRETEAGRPHTG
ncbi:MAG: hypothetical protein ACUVS7_05335 [Bryobacteraceae bacterium]